MTIYFIMVNHKKFDYDIINNNIYIFKISYIYYNCMLMSYKVLQMIYYMYNIINNMIIEITITVQFIYI